MRQTNRSFARLFVLVVAAALLSACHSGNQKDLDRSHVKFVAGHTAVATSADANRG